MRPPGSQARGLICLSKPGRRCKVLGLQRGKNSQKDEEEEIFHKQMPAGHTEAMGQRGILTNALLNSSSLSPLVPALLRLCVVMAPFPGQVLCLSSFRQVEGGHRFFLGLLFPENNQPKITHMPKRHFGCPTLRPYRSFAPSFLPHLPASQIVSA